MAKIDVNNYRTGYSNSNDAFSAYWDAATKNNQQPTNADKKILDKAYADAYKKSNSSSLSSSGNSGFIGRLVATQSENVSLNNLSDNVSKNINLASLIQDIADTTQGLITKEISFTDLVNKVTNAAKKLTGAAVLDYFEQQAALLKDFTESTMMLGELSSSFRKDIGDSSVYAEGMGVSFGEFATNITNIVRDTGRFMIMNEQTMNDLTLSSKLVQDGFDGIRNMAKDFNEVGLSMEYMNDFIKKATTDSISLGLNSKTTIKAVTENIDKLNQYGFKNGVEGLTKMVRQSQEFKLSMQEAFKIAEKVMDPEGALEMAANLQALGGAIGDFNDPIRLMYMSTNDVGGIQDSIINMAKGLATFNQETGKFELVGANLRQVRAMASAAGMEFKELANLAVNSAQRMSAMTDLSFKFPKLDEEEKEFITNLGRWSEKEGKMVIDIPKSLQEQFGGTQLAFDELTDTNAKMLLSQKEYFEKLTPEEVVREQLTLEKSMERSLRYIAASMVQGMGKQARETLKSAIGYDPIEASKELKNQINQTKNTTQAKMSEIGGMASEKINQFTDFNVHGGDKTSQTNTKEESKPTNIKHDVELSVNLKNVNSDIMSRHIRNNPEVLFDTLNIKREYISAS